MPGTALVRSISGAPQRRSRDSDLPLSGAPAAAADESGGGGGEEPDSFAAAEIQAPV